MKIAIGCMIFLAIGGAMAAATAHDAPPPKDQRGQWRWPLDNFGPGSITQDYSEYNACIDSGCTKRSGAHHTGIDVGATAGTPVKAVADGFVVNFVPNGAPGCSKTPNDPNSCRDHGDGNTIIIQHDRKHFSQYQHLRKPQSDDDLIAEVESKCHPYDQTINGARVAGYACTKKDRVFVTKGVTVVGHVGGTGFGEEEYWHPHLHFEGKNFSTLNASGEPTKFGYSNLHPFKLGFKDPVIYVEKTAQNKPSIHVKVSTSGDGVSFRIGPNTIYDKQRVGHATDPDFPDNFSALARSPATSGCDKGWYKIISFGSFPPPVSRYFEPENAGRRGPGDMPDVWVCIGNAGQTWVETAQ